MRCSTSGAIVGRDLEAARAGADHRHALAGEVDRVVPARRVERRTGEVVLPGDVGNVRTVELTDRGDHGARRRACPRCRRRRARAPTRWPARRPTSAPSTSVSKRTCGSMPCLLHHALEVRLQLGLLREELGPVVARLEAVAVEVVADVDARARVGVLPPGAADARVLLDDRERDAGFLEADRRRAARTRRSR